MSILAEVTKMKDGSDYPGKTLYQLCVSIQKYLCKMVNIERLLKEILASCAAC